MEITYVPDPNKADGKPVSFAPGQPVTASSWGTVTTSASGSTFVALSSGACSQVILMNFTGVDLDVQKTGDPITYRIPNGIGYPVVKITDSSTVSLRRTDQSGTQVGLVFERQTMV